MKRILAITCAMAICLSSLLGLSGCSEEQVSAGGNANITAVVIGSETERDKVSNQLKNGIMANLDVSYDVFLGDHDIAYIESLTDDVTSTEVEAFVMGGGTAVIDNSCIRSFSNEFLGAEEIVEFIGMPIDLEYHYTEDNLTNISQLIYDYTLTIKSYVDFPDYEAKTYGDGIIPSTAKVIAGKDGIGLYTVNKYGKGTVFVTNPILPSDYTVTELRKGEEGEPMAYSTTAAENLLRGYYAEYVSKAKYGFAVERTFGTYGTKPAAWTLHYEDITGIENGSMTAFTKYCIENNQMPSYTLIRNAYTWFKRSESVTYLTYDGGFKADAYEGAYCSGRHIVSGSKWLELDYYENTNSYFEDNSAYIKRAYPFPADWNEDGNMDLIVGSADGNIYYFQGNGMGTNYEVSAPMYFTDENGNKLNPGGFSSPVIFDINGDGKGEIVTGSEDGTIRAYKSLKTEKNPDSMAFSYMYDVLGTGLYDSMISAGHLNNDNIMDLAVGSRSGEMRVYYGYTEDGKTTFYNDYVTVATNENWISPCIHNGKLFGGTREGYVATFEFDGEIYKKTGYVQADVNSRRGNKNVTIGMNSVPRFYDIDNDGDEDLIMGSLEYGMAYPIDSEYFPYRDELIKQLQVCDENGLYVGVHGLTHKYASPEQEALELEYHKKAFESYGLPWAGQGVNQHTWFTSNYGYDGSGIDGYNPSYNGTFAAQNNSGLLWNSGSTLPEADFFPENCAENAIPMPQYLPEYDYMVFETCNTPHGDGTHTYTTVKYEMPLLFYNHCDYMYESPESQMAASDRVGELVNTYDYMFMREDQLAKAVCAAYNTDFKVDTTKAGIFITATSRDCNKALYDEKFAGSVGVKVVFADGSDANRYTTDAVVSRVEGNAIYVSVGNGVIVSEGSNSGLRIKGVNTPARIKTNRNSATIRFLEEGMMSVRVEGEAYTKSKGWKTEKDGHDTVFVKFGKADTLKIKR